MQSDDHADLRAQSTLTELIDNNKQILESRIKFESIGQFLDLLIQKKHEKYVILLRALVNCDGQAIQRNQNDITNLILNFDEVKNKLLYKILMKRNFTFTQRDEEDDDLAMKDIRIIAYDK